MGRKLLTLTAKCKVCSVNFEKRKPSGGLYREKVFCSSSCAMTYWGKHRKQAVRTPEWNRKIGDSQRGSKGSNWKGGVTPINRIIRHSSSFRLWREAVFKRDNWTCQECRRRGGELHPHHIKPFAFFPELRFAINNGVTLCKECHKQTDTYGRKMYKNGTYKNFL